MKHFALIPAKKNSTRCQNKNWREFVNGMSLVDFSISRIPGGFFNKVIVSTDNIEYNPPEGIEKHLRNKSLSGRDSHVEDLIKLIIREYNILAEDYIWMLNPTSPFRTKEDYRAIARIIDEEMPNSVISAVKIHPFIWKDNDPMFETKGNRKHTQDFIEKFFVENGMFFAAKASHFIEYGSWFGKDVTLYKQYRLWCFMDIDTEDDFLMAQKVAETFFSEVK